MKYVVLIFFLFFSIVLQAKDRVSTVTVGNKILTCHYELDSIVDDNDTKTMVFIDEKNNKISLVLSNSWNDSNSISVEYGDYQVKEDTLILYSYWYSWGDAPVSPHGVRKLVYVFDADGELKLADTKIYLEEVRPYWGEYPYKGIRFLKSSPNNESDHLLLKLYKTHIEKEYSASFVDNESEKDVLLKEAVLVFGVRVDKLLNGMVGTFWGDSSSGFNF